jgi:cellulose synthase (UDP-forming)
MAVATHKRLAEHYECAITGAGILVTLVAGALFCRELFDALPGVLQRGAAGGLLEWITFSLIAGFLIYGNLVYQVARFGHHQRLAHHLPASRDCIDAVFDQPAPPLTMLVPSYCEEPAVVYMTLMSAALTEYPNRRVVLLIDDSPSPVNQAARKNLDAMRQMPAAIEARLARAAEPLVAAESQWKRRCAEAGPDIKAESPRLEACFDIAASWFENIAESWKIEDHSHQFFVDRVLLSQARELRLRGEALRVRANEGDAGNAEHVPLTVAEVSRQYARLASLFRVSLSSFERKRYINLSHEPNKAMNLNSYIALLGGRYCEEHRKDGTHLVACAENDPATLEVPPAAYVLTLDADSMLFPDYALRLAQVLSRPENADVGVIQTPYSAYPGAPGVLERIAGATTDIQHIIHQGFTALNATYWVGANALLRVDALRDICVEVVERGYPIARYITDHTVIEDTESSIDLAHKGWRLLNYPARLSYSATPADYGAFLIQRRRWANGGLLIVPSLLRYLVNKRQLKALFTEGPMRLHYLVSLTAVSCGVLAMLLYPFEEFLRSLWLPLAALPYFVLYGRDLLLCGYRPTDLLRVYSLNLLLIPINLGGVLLSVRQAITGRRSPFGRTPKIAGRTAAPPLYSLSTFALAFLCISQGLFDLVEKRYAHAVFALLNGLFLVYACHRFIGLRVLAEDLVIRMGMWHRQATPAAVVSVDLEGDGKQSVSLEVTTIPADEITRMPGMRG